MTHDPHAHHAPNVKAYLAVFGVLMVLTVVTVAIAYLRLPIAAAILIAMAVASVKAGLVGAFFMHLKGERVLIFWLLGLTVLFLLFLYGIPSVDVSLLTGDVLRRQPLHMESHEAHAEHVP